MIVWVPSEVRSSVCIRWVWRWVPYGGSVAGDLLGWFDWLCWWWFESRRNRWCAHWCHREGWMLFGEIDYWVGTYFCLPWCLWLCQIIIWELPVQIVALFPYKTRSHMWRFRVAVCTGVTIPIVDIIWIPCSCLVCYSSGRWSNRRRISCCFGACGTIEEVPSTSFHVYFRLFPISIILFWPWPVRFAWRFGDLWLFALWR